MRAGPTFGLVGLGDVALTWHLPTLLARGVRLTAAADPDPARLAAAPLPPGTRRYASGEELVRDGDVDAIVLATPPWVTCSLAAAALAAGKWVLAEKPLAPSLAEARRLAPAGRLQVGLTYRHHPAIERLRELVAGGALGRPLLFQVVVADERADPQGDPEHYARIVRTLEHGPPAIHEGAHVADRLGLLLGEQPVAVSAWSLRTIPDLPAPNVNGALLRYGDGTVARLEIVWLLPVLPPSAFVVSGPLGRAVLDPPSFALRFDGAGGESETLEPPGPKTETCFALQLERFLHAIETGERPVPGLDEGLASLELCERIAAAAA